MAQQTRDQFIRHVIDVIKHKFPLVKVARSDQQTFSVRMNGHVASLENLYRIAQLRPDESQHQIERWAVELIRASEGSPDQSAGLDELKDRVLPMVLSSMPEVAGQSPIASQPLVAGLHVAYALDSDRTISYIPMSTIKAWNADLDDIHNLALSNLVTRSKALSAHAAQDEDGKINLILFQTMDGFDASRVLLPTLHDKLRDHLGSPFAAGIPNRDILLCFRNDNETVDRLRSQIQADYRQMPHSITDALLLITPDGIAPRD